MTGEGTGPIALAVADSNWFNTDNLFAATPADRATTLLLSCMDYRNALRKGIPLRRWAGGARPDGPGRWRRDLVLPPGWMKRFPRWGMRPIAGAVRRWHRRAAPGLPLALVMSYPHYLHLADRVRPDRLVYYNIDDYALYWPAAADAVRAMERRAVLAADLTVCVSKLRAEELRAAVPEAASRVQHLPHGAPAWSIEAEPWRRPAPRPDDLAALPGPLLGFVGALEDRVDWALLLALARAFPHASLVLVGRLGPEAGDADRAACLAMPNVHTPGWRPQGEIHRYNRAFDVALIPYRVDHPFNVACCPTKIMDTMGTGRPTVSTALPECRLYADLFDVAESTGAFLDAVATILDSGSDDGRAVARHAWAVDHTCAKVAGRLLDMLGGPGIDLALTDRPISAT